MTHFPWLEGGTMLVAVEEMVTTVVVGTLGAAGAVDAVFVVVVIGVAL